MSVPPVLGTTREDVLLAEYVRSRQPALEEELVKRFMPLARSLAMRYRGGAERSEDLIQVASLALVKALRGYDPERGKRFPAYAAPTILGELRRHFRDHSWRLHMPRSLQERTLEVERLSTELGEELGRAPTVGEVAERSGLEEEDVLDVYQAREAQRSMSLDVPVHRDEADSVPMIETVGGEESGFDAVEAQMAIERSAKLDEREQEVIRLRFAEGLNQYEIGESAGGLPDAGLPRDAPGSGEAARGGSGGRGARREAHFLRRRGRSALPGREIPAAQAQAASDSSKRR